MWGGCECKPTTTPSTTVSTVTANNSSTITTTVPLLQPIFHYYNTLPLLHYCHIFYCTYSQLAKFLRKLRQHFIHFPVIIGDHTVMQLLNFSIRPWRSVSLQSSTSPQNTVLQSPGQTFLNRTVTSLHCTPYIFSPEDTNLHKKAAQYTPTLE